MKIPKVLKNEEDLDLHPLVWMWPITVPIGVVMLVAIYVVYAWIRIGNILINLTVNNPKLHD